MAEHAFQQFIGDGRLDNLIELFDTAATNPKAELELNFEFVEQIDSCGYAILSCLSDVLREQGIRAKAHSLVGQIEKEYLRKILSNDGSSTLLRINEFDLDNNEVLLKGVEQAIDPNFPDQVERKFGVILGEEKCWYVRLILNELMQNSLDHSTSERYFLYSGVHEDATGANFHFGVCDMGVTIPAKLSSKYQCDSDVAYLEKSLEYQVGTRRTRHGGLGLNHMFNILKNQKGRLVLVSRKGQLRRYFHSRKVDRKELPLPLRGTWCMARIPLDKK